MSRFTRPIAAFALAAAAATVPAAAAAAQQPNLSGTWVLDASKSDLGMMAQMMGGDPKITLVVDHKEPNVTIKTTTETPRGTRTNEQALTTDGKEVTTTGPRGGTATTTAKWDKTNLVITSVRETPQGAFHQMQTLVLSADGKTLTIDAKIQSPMGELATTQVFQKQ